jgi:hypothetical protein
MKMPEQEHAKKRAIKGNSTHKKGSTKPEDNPAVK